ncbi:MAG: hypothetical protein FJ390_08155 [Verrucomicrobia bacterium]|nr:hypothetical protein [Verrucomicrobiota bacterium]
MNFKNLFSFIAIPVVIIAALTACQRNSSRDANSEGPFQCISATIMIAGKPTATVVQWNAKTGMARILDSMVVTSKATGAQNVVVGWIPLGDLQGAIQEIMSRNQQAMQQQVAPTPQAVAPEQEAAAGSTTSSKKRK